jgi:ribonucleotide reductase, class II
MPTSNQLPTPLQEYVHKSRYARWINDLNRRETWEETVQRYVDYFGTKFPEHYPKQDIYDGIVSLKTMPSMRALMTAGPALERDPMAGYNCSFIAIDDVRAFDEILYILMCGTGLGFSVERQFIAQLPIIGASIHVDEEGKTSIKTADTLSPIDHTIVVRDSKSGWAGAFRELLTLLYAGKVPKWDVSKVRPAGAKLKVFGGRASGPEPLVDLFNFAVSTFKKAIGRKLNSVECHDLVCKIADIVVVGGVRRSALISLSNLSDDRMRGAKSGQWWVTEPQRALANNSAAYTERPQMELFMKEWLSLIESKSGERGIFNREAAIKKAIESGRRDHTKVVGVNPCFAPGTLIHTTEGAFPIETLVGKKVTVWDGTKQVTIDNFRVTGENAEVLKLTLQDGSEIKATPYHKFILADGSTVEMKDLEPGMKLLISNAPVSQRMQSGIHAQSAYLKGFLIGDGSMSNSGPLLWLYAPKFTCEQRLLDSALETKAEVIKTTNPVSLPGFIDAGEGRKRMQGLTQRRTELSAWGSTYKNGLPVEVFAWDHFSKVEFLTGLFDADGCALDTANGYGYQLSSISKQLLLDVQTLLKTIGVFGKVTLNKEASTTDFNDGNGTYPTKALYRLTLSQEAAITFANCAEFERLQSFMDRSMKYQLKPRWNSIASIEHAGIEEKVYCCTVPGSHQVSLAVGVTTGQCAEITLRSAGLCNLSEVVVRADDTLVTLCEKVRIATIIGTYQSMLTDFRYVRSIWKKNQEEERLLGVSLTGIMDHPVLSQTSEEAKCWLQSMKEVAIEVNATWAKKLGINQSVAITTVKPSGTVSQLVDSASGIHPRYSEYYIRTVRADKKDPLAKMMRDQGFPVEDCVSKPDSVDIFSFPVEGPNHAVFRNDRSAIEQLEHVPDLLD